MNKKTIMTMLVAGALSVSALSTTAVFAEDAVVNENTPAVTETTTSTYQPEYKQLTDTWTGNNDIVFEVDGQGGFFYVDSIEPFDSNGDGSTYINSTIQPKVELDANGKGKITFSSDAIKKAKYYYHAEEVNQLDWTKVDTIAISMGFRKGTYITGETFYVPIKLDASETTKPSATLKSNAFTGDNDIVLDVNTTDGKVVFGQVELCSSDYTYINTTIEPKVEFDANGKGTLTVSKDDLKNAIYFQPELQKFHLTWEEIASKIDTIALNLEFTGQDSVYTVQVPVKLNTTGTTTPEKPSEPTTPSKPSDDKGTTTITPNAPAAKDDKKTNTTTSTKTNTTTTTKKEAPKTGDTMNVALYASLLVVSALFAVVLTTKKRITE